MILDFLTDLVKSYLAVVIIWFVTLIIVIITLTKRTDILTPVKIFWGFIIFIAPVLGLIIYLVYGLKRKKKLLPKTEKNINLTKG